MTPAFAEAISIIALCFGLGLFVMLCCIAIPVSMVIGDAVEKRLIDDE